MRKTAALLSFLLPFATLAQTADQIIQEYLRAIGGLEKLKKVQTVKMTGNFVQGTLTIPMTLYQKRPNMHLVEVTFQGMTQKIAYDGKEAWSIDPFQGRTVAAKLDADQTKQQRFQADIDGPLVDYAAKGYKVDYVGKETIDGVPAFHLRLTTQEGDIYDYFFDEETYLLIKEKSNVKMQDGSVESQEINFSDYKEINGLLIPHSMEMVGEFQGQKFSSYINIESVVHNVPLDESMFRMPEK
ncbi:MAG: hypothetical protein NZL95_08255 [Chitinophagales bacterium]|nr:hypothetical protein [Chitinophagales bacterium]MDW8428529.1 hypothetical protein [Chitinophagales bacterium]